MNNETMQIGCPMCSMKFGIHFEANTSYQDKVRERAEFQLEEAAADHFKRKHLFEKEETAK